MDVMKIVTELFNPNDVKNISFILILLFMFLCLYGLYAIDRYFFRKRKKREMMEKKQREISSSTVEEKESKIEHKPESTEESVLDEAMQNFKNIIENTRLSLKKLKKTKMDIEDARDNSIDYLNKMLLSKNETLVNTSLLLGSFLDAMTFGIMIYDTSFMVLYCNDTMLDILEKTSNVSRNEILYHNMLEMSSEFSAWPLKTMDLIDYLTQMQMITSETDIICRDGRYRKFLTKRVPVLNSENKLYRILFLAFEYGSDIPYCNTDDACDVVHILHDETSKLLKMLSGKKASIIFLDTLLNIRKVFCLEHERLKTFNFKKHTNLDQYFSHEVISTLQKIVLDNITVQEGMRIPIDIYDSKNRFHIEGYLIYLDNVNYTLVLEITDIVERP